MSKLTKAGNLLPKSQIAMSSLEIAEISGKKHAHVLTSIRTMESAWEKVTETKFRFSEYKDKSGRKLPMFELTKRECLFVASKYNDEIRARIIVRLDELETTNIKTLPETTGSYQEETVINIKLGERTTNIYVKGGVIFTKFMPLMHYLGYLSRGVTKYIERYGSENFIQVEIRKQLQWFINVNGFDNLAATHKKAINNSLITTVYNDVFMVERRGYEQEVFAFKFTHSEMYSILTALNSSPINKSKVTNMLLDGNTEGGLS